MGRAVTRIGILGGTFDPPHIGHLLLGETAFEQLRLDVVLFLPAGQPPHKLDEPVSDIAHRLAMTRLAIEDNHHFRVDTVDITRPHPHYTSTLLPVLEKSYPNSVFWLLIGGDSLRDLPSWHDPVAVVSTWRFAVLSRPGADIDWEWIERTVPGVNEVTEQLDGPSVAVSSTQIRRWAAEGRSLRYVLPRKVARYLRENQLYQGEAT